MSKLNLSPTKLCHQEAEFFVFLLPFPPVYTLITAKRFDNIALMSSSKCLHAVKWPGFWNENQGLFQFSVQKSLNIIIIIK